ncbi:MAG TPA: C4-type zinc ribbon domain-containing protein [Anaerolineales bacterium]|nr:C4-type zinc ribbon domain-containing protein [Anaerolineales bacterium]
MSQTLSLYRLQQIDTQIDRARTRLAAIKSVLENDDSMREATEKLQATEAASRSAESSLSQAEHDVQEQRIKIEQIEASLYGGSSHSPKELQDLQNDVAALKRHLSTLEDRQLDAMLACEQAESDHKSALVELDKVQARWSEQNRHLEQEQQSLQNDSDRLTKERGAIADGLSTTDLGLYDKLRQEHRGVAVAAINEKSCSACGSSLSAGQVQSARSSGQIGFCPSCGRILYGS